MVKRRHRHISGEVVCLLDIQTLGTQIIALIGVTGALLGIYKGYTEITNIKKTRQAQLFMRIYDHMNDPAFQRAKVWLLFETGHLEINSEEFRYTQAQEANPDAWAGFPSVDVVLRRHRRARQSTVT
jgi:hypothetical protein